MSLKTSGGTSTGRPRRTKLVLLVLAVALVGLGVWAWEPLWVASKTPECLGG